MPTVSLDRDELFSRLGRTFTEKEFDELCFQFGIELDEVMTEEVAQEKRHAASSTGAASRVLYYIAVPANRYDLLCMEGISRALNIFMQRVASPVR
jgi:phenylalanyl-tRNA synthetase beta chain